MSQTIGFTNDRGTSITENASVTTKQIGYVTIEMSLNTGENLSEK